MRSPVQVVLNPGLARPEKNGDRVFKTLSRLPVPICTLSVCIEVPHQDIGPCSGILRHCQERYRSGLSGSMKHVQPGWIAIRSSRNGKGHDQAVA